MAHDHEHHSHGQHGHTHSPLNYGGAFAIGIALNVGLSLLRQSMATQHTPTLFADAGHNLSDVLGLHWPGVQALLPPTKRYTGCVVLQFPWLLCWYLLLSMGAIGWEAIRRFSNPVAGATVIGVALVGCHQYSHCSCCHQAT